jgi:hypothetical protein
LTCEPVKDGPSTGEEASATLTVLPDPRGCRSRPRPGTGPIPFPGARSRQGRRLRQGVGRSPPTRSGCSSRVWCAPAGPAWPARWFAACGIPMLSSSGTSTSRRHPICSGDKAVDRRRSYLGPWLRTFLTPTSVAATGLPSGRAIVPSRLSFPYPRSHSLPTGFAVFGHRVRRPPRW